MEAHTVCTVRVLVTSKYSTFNNLKKFFDLRVRRGENIRLLEIFLYHILYLLYMNRFIPVNITTRTMKANKYDEIIMNQILQ